MKFLLMSVADEEIQAKWSPEEDDRMRKGYGNFAEELAAAGKLLAAERLRPADRAKTIRVTNGRTDIVDGPFAETKEALAGFYLVECESMDEAIKLAAKCATGTQHGAIEVRPIWDRP